MISYDNYKNRIEKLAKAKRILHKFRFLICGVLALIIGASVGLMCAKGAYMSDTSLSARTVYFNEYYEVTPAKAFLASPSEQHLEYRSESGGWTGVKPVKAGKYSARTVTKKIVGYSYSPEVDFEILPVDAQFAITGGSMTYGDIPRFTVTGLIAGHRVDKEALDFDYDRTAQRAEVSVVESSLKIVDESGDDFTGCYNIVRTSKTLNINNRFTNATPSPCEFTYDGTQKSSVDEVTLDGLAKGDTVTATTRVDGGAINAGGYSIKIDGIKIMHGDADVTARYDINRSPSLLTINPRKLTIRTESAEKVYDGKPFEDVEFACENAVKGHVVSLDTSTLNKNANIGTYDNIFGVIVLDGLTDVTRNYEIDENNSTYGTLKINPRRLTVTTATPEAHVYDGYPFTDYGFEVAESVGKGFVFNAVEGSLSHDTTDAGAYDNDFKIAVSLNGDIVTENFEITYNCGKLTVIKRIMNVTTGSDEKVYDGQPFVCDNPVENGKVPEHSLKVSKEFSVTDVTGANGVKNEIKYTVVDGHGKDVGYNYIINHVSGTLTIEPLKISVKTLDDSMEYDGTALTNGGYIATRINAEGFGLYGNDELIVTNLCGIVQAGSIANANKYRVPTYDEAHSNYEIVGEIEHGTLTVLPKKVTVTINHATAVYGEDVPDNGFTLDCGALPNGEELTFTTRYEKGGSVYAPVKWQGYTLLDVGMYYIANSGDEAIVGGNASLGNYELSFASGILNITQREIYYKTATAEKEYDGKYLQNTAYETFLAADDTKAGLLGGDELTVRPNSTSIVNVEERPNANYYNLPLYSNNYRINQPMSTAAFGTLKITPRQIIVITADDTKTYDGNPLENTDYTVKYAVKEDGKWVADDTKDGLIAGDELTLTGEIVSITNAGDIKNSNRYENPNYDIKDYADGTLEVTKKELNIALADVQTQYGFWVAYQTLRQFDGVNGEIIYVDVGFKKDGEKLNCDIIGNDVVWRLPVGTYTIYPVECSVDNDHDWGSGGLELDNYEINCEESTLTILPRPVTVDINDGTAVYGEDVSGKEYGVTTYPDELPYNERLTLTYKYDREVGDVGDYEIFKDKVYIDGKEVDPENCNYDFTFNEGTLTVTQKALTVYLNYYDNAEKIYYGTPWAYAAGIGNYALAYGLVDGEQLEIAAALNAVSGDARYNEQTGKYEPAVGSYYTDITSAKIYVDGVEKENGIRNYSISVMQGNLSVETKPITVTFADNAVEYGDDLTDFKPAYVTSLDGKMPYNESFEFGGFAYVLNGEIAPKKKSVGEYEIRGKELVFYDENGNGIENGKSNYNITYEGVLTVNKKNVHIKLNDRTIKYGFEYMLQGLATHKTRFESVDGSSDPVLAYGEVLHISVGYKSDGKVLDRNSSYEWRLSVGEYTSYAVRFYVLENEEANRYIDEGLELENYEIICEEGAVEITPYTVKVKPNDRTCVYGTPEDEIEDTGFEYTDGWTVDHGGLPYGENLLLSYSYDPSPVTDAGEYKINATATGVEDGDLKNYTVVYEQGTLTVTERKIYVVFNDDNKTTYGTAPEKISYKITTDAEGEVKEYSLPDGYIFCADIGYYIYGDPDKTAVTVKNVGEYGITAFDARIETSSGETSGNYAVEVVDGKLTVNKKTVTVELNKIGSVVYGETFLYAAGVDNFANFNEIELAYNERLEVAVEYLIDGVVGTPKNANEYESSAAYSARLKVSGCTVYESDGETAIENGVDNYNFVCEVLSDLVIKVRRIRIYLNDLDDVQYGNAVVYPDGPNNFKRIEDLSGNVVEDTPYGEQFKVEIYYRNKNNEQIENPVDMGVYTIHSHLTATAVYESDGVTEIDGGYNNYRIFFGTGSVEIVPRKITIQLKSFEIDYGDFGYTFGYPGLENNYDLNNSDSLVYGQKLEVEVKYQQVVDGVLKDVEPKYVGKYFIAVDDYAVYDGEETYYDGCYEINFVAGELTISKKRIDIRIDNKSCTYGEDLPENSYVIKNSDGEDYALPYGDEFEALAYCYLQDGAEVTPRNAGKYEIRVGEYAITNDTDDVSHNYTVVYTLAFLGEHFGTLTIGKADLEITLPEVKGMTYGDEWIYPYKEIGVKGLRYNEALNAAVKYFDGDGNLVAVPKNAGAYTVVLDKENCGIKNEDLTEGLLSNYEISSEDGMLTIDKRALEVNFKEDYFDIDYGDPLPELEPVISEDGSDGEEYELPYGEQITFGYRYLNLDTNEYETPKRAGFVYEVQINRVYIDGVAQTNASCNYTISYGAHGEPWIKIWEKIVKPTIKDFTKVYGETISYYFEGAEKYDENGKEFYGYGERARYKVRYLQNGAEVTPVNVGVYDIEVINYTVYDKDGAEIENGADNYRFEPECGQMTIIKAAVTVTVDDQTVTYGDDLSKLENGFAVDCEMPYGEQFELSYSCELVNPDAGEYENAITAEVVAVNGGSASLYNYDIVSVISGKLTVKQRELTVTVKGGSATYGYTQLPEIKHEITEGGLVGEEKLVPAYVFSLNGTACEPVNAGVYDIEVDEANTTVEGGNALYVNYKVTYVYDGKLVINASPLTVKIIGDSFVYGDRALNVTFEITDGELFHGDTLVLDFIYTNSESYLECGEPTAAGTYFICATASVEGGNARVENYEISYVDNQPTLTIEKREIEIRLNQGGVTQFTYGTDYASAVCNASVVNPADGQTVKVAVTYAKKQESVFKMLRTRAFSAREAETLIPKDAGWYVATLDFDNCTVTDAEGEVEGGINNYVLKADCSPVEFEITPMRLTVTVTDAEITYGDELPVSLGYGVSEQMPDGESLKLTFSLIGEEGKLPVHVGEYAVSIAGEEINGGKITNYSLEYTNAQPKLTITKKEVNVRVYDLSVPFGTAVSYRVDSNNYNRASSDVLVEGDELTVTGVKYVGGDGVEYEGANLPVNAGAYDVILVSFKIANADGEDATGDYAVTGLNGTLNINTSVVIVYTASAEKEYDGTPLYTDEYDRYEGDLYGYNLVVDESSICRQTNATAGDGADNTTKFKIVDGSGVETNNLEVRYGADNTTFGKLKVTRRRIEIKSESASKIYDGTALTAGYELIYKGETEGANAVADTDIFTVIGTVEQIDAGDTDNTVLFTITREGKDASANYQIERSFGVLTVETKLVYVTIDRATAIYGVQPEITHTTDVPLAEGEKLGFDVEYRNDDGTVTPELAGGYFILPAGNYRTYYADGTAYITGGRASVDNYRFVFALGAEFEVTPRHIAITTESATHQYDGTDFSSYDDYTTEWVVDGVRKEGESGLLGGDLLTVDEYASIKDVGSCENVCTYTVSGNYVIDEALYEYGMLTVTQRAVTVKTADITETYDGESHSSGVLTYDKTRLIGGHEFKVVSALVAPVDCTTGVDNELTVIVVDTGDGDKDVTANYDIKYDYGKIIINRRPLDVTTGSVKVTYDGAYHGNNEPDAVGDNLLTELGHELAVNKSFTRVNATAGTDNATTYKVVCGGKDITANYKINYTYGQIVIEPKPVTVTLNEGVEVQYGEDFAKVLTEGAVTLVDGESCVFAVITDRAVDGVGTYTATADWTKCVVSNAKGVIANGVSNYAPEFVPASRTFEVVAREIEVTLNAGGNTEFKYGDDYDTAIRTVTVDSMVAGETLKVAVTYNVAAPKNVGEYTAELNLSGCTVDGGDIANYDIVSCGDVTFKIVARDLTVHMRDITVGYNETPEYPDGEIGYTKIEGLAYDDEITVIPTFEKDGKEVTTFFAGVYDVVCGGIKVNGSEDGAENYNVITGKPYGKLTVTGVGIEIVRKTVTKVYDGEPLELNADAPESEVGYIINGDESVKLPAGYRLVLDGAFATADGNVSSSRDNTAKYKVLNADDEEAGEYVVSYLSNGARLNITPKPLTVTTDSATRKYNGLPLTAGYSYDSDELVSGHVLTASNAASITDEGSKPNTMDITITADGVNVTANYEVIKTVGTLTVEKLPVEVEIADMTKVYGEDTGASKIYRCELVNGEKLNYRVKFSDTANPLNVGTYGITADESKLSVTGGKLSNYEITFKEGATLTVTERHIIITTADATAEYSGTALTKTDGYKTVWVKDGIKQGKAGLVGEDTLTVATVAAQTEIGSCKNECSYTVSDNYVIDGYVYGTLTVTKRDITVTTGGITETYCGTAYSNGAFTYDESRLLEGHTVERSGELPQFLDAIQGADNVFGVVITAGGEDVTGYYNISYEYGKVNIAKKALTVTLNDEQTSFVYGDDTFDGKFKQVTAVGLVDGETLTVALAYNPSDGSVPVNAGSYTVSLDTANSSVAYAGEGNGIGNYEITCAAVDFEITRRAITLTLGEWAAEEYDGNEHAYDTENCRITDGALLDGESLASVAVKYCSDTDGLVLTGTPKDAGTYYVFLDESATSVLGANGRAAVSTNYEVSCAYITFKVTPKKLVITLSDVSHTYDGKEYDFASGDGFTSNLCDGDEIEYGVIYDETPVNAGTYTVTLDTDNLECSDNYELDLAASTLSCTLTIDRREITVTVADRDVERGNEEYSKADITADFVEGDLDKATVTFSYAEKLPVPAGAVAYYTVSVTLGGDVMENYTCEVVDGTLTVTERKVLVTPVFGGTTPYVYDGNAVNISLFGYVHGHNVEGAADDDKYGFTDEDAASFTATYSFTDENGDTVVGTPVNAGTYTVSLTLSGEGISGYSVTYETIEFTIEWRALSYTVEVEGADEFVYSNSRPAFEAQLTDYDGFAGGTVPAYTFELFDGDEPVTRYNVGTYQVKLSFAGMENYDIDATAAEITIIPRTIVVTPNDPYGGVAQEYDGENLTLDGSVPNVLGDGLASGDELTFTSSELEPTSASGYLKITDVEIFDGDIDAKENYNVYITYNAGNAVIKELGLRISDFRVSAEFVKTKVHYTLGELGKTFPYTGKSFTYSFDGDGAATLSDGETLGFGHEIGLSKNSVNVPAAAGEYADLISRLVRVYDENGNVMAIYELICDNPEDGVIYVKENVLSVDLSGVSADTLESGVLGCAVTGLFSDEASEHKAQVYAFNLDGEWLIGVTVFTENAAGRRTDFGANYTLSESSVLEGATVKIITLAEAEEYARPAIGVQITVTESELESGRGTLYAFDGESKWILQSGYTLSGELQEGHELQVLVFRENGGYVLGVTVFRTDNGKDARNVYRLKAVQTAGVAARYVAVGETATMQRGLYIDFDGAFDEEGALKVDEDGFLTGYNVEGLSEGHEIEVTATENGDGTYSLNVVVYELKKQGSTYKKLNRAVLYDLSYSAPAGVGVTVVTGAIN